MNSDTEVAWRYHNGTKHPNGALLNRFHSYDPRFRTAPYKVYENISKTPLKLDKSSIGVSALEALSKNVVVDKEKVPDIEVLSRMLYFSGGITKTIFFPRIGDVEFRAASCTGALYHIEIYVVCGDLPGISAGVYHYDPSKMNFELIRSGDYRRVIVDACADKSVNHAPAILVCTDIFTRNSVKYQTREYRHAFWDCGTILANALAMCAAHALPAKLVLGFVDKQINSLLDINTQKEVSLALLSIGYTTSEPSEKVEIAKLDLPTEQLSDYDFDDPEILKMHESSSLQSAKEVREWVQKTSHKGYDQPKKELKLKPSADDKKSIESVIIRRGSTRKFARKPILFSQLSSVIHYSTSEVASDFVESYGRSLVDIYLIANSVDGLKKGSYFYHRDSESLEPLEYGNFRNIAGRLGLDQDLAADGSVCAFFMADLNAVFEKFGNRGYRAAQLEASITGGRFYLASYAQGLGATGLTFYDDDVTNFFLPHSEGKSIMFMVVLGHKQKG